MLNNQNKIDYMKTRIERYIASKNLSWSASTIRTERYRLLGLLTFINGTPSDLWDELERRNMSPYSRKTVWIRVCKFWEWATNQNLLSGPNPYRKWMDENHRLFKHVYKKSLPTISFEEARARILKLKDDQIKKQALSILDNGLRVSEYNTYQDGNVIGKGQKPRKLFGEAEPEGWLSYYKFLRALQKIGLKPHDLRKIRATDLVNKGCSESDLCYIFGWESFETASSYLAPKKDLTLEEMFKQK